MPDISITPSDVTVVTSGNFAEGTVSEAVDAGEMCYRVSGTTYALADAGDTEAKAASPVMALSSGAAGQIIKFAATGRIDIGAAIDVGDVLVLSAANPGKIAPPSDLASTNYFTLVGVGVGAGIIELRPYSTGEQVPA